MYLQEFAASLAFVSIPGADSRAVRILVYVPEIQHIPRVTAFPSTGGKRLWANRLLAVIPSRKLREQGEGTSLFFESETSADPWFPCPIVVWRGRGMIWLAGDVLLYGFLGLPDGLLNFLFEGWFLSRGKGGVFLVEFLC